MKNRQVIPLRFAFFLAIAGLAWLYLFWRRNKEVMPQPLVIRRESSLAPREDNAAPEAPESDALERIRGIGPATAGHLNEAGVHSFRQLAQMTPEQVTAITGSSRWDPAEWIEEARRLVGA